MTPLTLEFPDDPRCRENLHQYLLGRDLMVVIYKREAYFPAGRWKDFWTGEVIEGGCETTISWPENRGGGLYVRGGGIVALGPVMQYRGEKPLDEIELYVFPDAEESATVLYEDDGVSLEHCDGEHATTRVRAVDDGRKITVTVEETRGSFEGQCPDRTWSLTVAVDGPPAAVLANGTEILPDDATFDPDRGELSLAPLRGPVDLEIRR